MPPETGCPERIVSSPSAEEWQLFQAWANGEGWRVPRRELTLYRNELADSAFVLRGAEERPLGFVTVCRQQRSAWIGNLLVAAKWRGRGVGRRLFAHATGFLAERGASTLWLTASPEGLPLYASYGFQEAGRIERWVRPAEDEDAPAVGHASEELYPLAKADESAWGDTRAELLTLLARGGRILASGQSIALVQPGEDLNVIGPWLSADHCPRANRNVLNEALESCRQGSEVAIDIMSGSSARLLLAAAGFVPKGETVLMTRGATGRERLASVVALASLGSLG